MDQRERYLDDAEVFRIAMESWQTRMWTALPAVIKQFPSASGLGPMIADVQPTVNGRVRTTAGIFQSIQMPILLDCPVVWQGGGGVTLTFPIKANDECLVVFSSRCIDAWWQQGFIAGQAGVPVSGKQPMDPPDLRMHNLSDGFVLVGVRSLPRSYSIDTANVSLQSDDGEAFYKLNPTTHAAIITAPGGINLNGVTIDSSGNINSPATITASTDVVGDGISLKTHVHSGVETGGSDTGPPT
jgi:hypothetical protein